MPLGTFFAESDAAKTLTSIAAQKTGCATSSTGIFDLNSALSHNVQQFSERSFIRFAGADLTFAESDIAVAKLAGGF